jgi:hypothetical protein
MASNDSGFRLENGAASSLSTPVSAHLGNMAEYLANIYSNDPALQLKSTQQFRRLLSIGNLFLT